MRTLRLVILLLAVASWAAAPLAAQQFENVPEAKPAVQAPAPAGVNIGVLNIQAAIFGTQEGKKGAEDLRAQFSPREAELQKLQDEIRDLDNQLRTQERTLSDEARFQLARQIDTKRKLGTRAQQDLQEDAEQAQNDLFSRIGQKMRRVLSQYAREKNLSIILDTSQGVPVIYAAPAVDITEDIVRLYDQTYPLQATGQPTQPTPARSSAPPKKQN